MTTTYHLIWVCSDCMFHEANGECSSCAGQTHEQDSHDRPPLGLLEGQDISLGMLFEKHAHGCAVHDHNDHVDDFAECDKDCENDDFSWSECEGCGSNLGGSRHAMTITLDEPRCMHGKKTSDMCERCHAE
jgi:hypothetical protein